LPGEFSTAEQTANLEIKIKEKEVVEK